MRRFSAKIYLFLIISLLPLLGQAAQISAQQIAQFQRLSPTQQQALANSLGVDLTSIKQQLQAAKYNNNSKGINSSVNSDALTNKNLSVNTNNQHNLNSIPQDPVEKEKSKLLINKYKPKPFGYETFANESNGFAPNYDIAIPENYIIGSGDVLDIKIFGKENYSYQIPVSREGQIVIHELGAYQVAGLTFEDMKKFLIGKIKEKILGVEAVVTLSQLRSIRVFVLGEAYKPGAYTLSSLSSITHALFAAGGLTDIGSLRNIQLKRRGKLITTLDLYDLLIKGDSSNDVILRSGDVVFISPVGRQVTVSGDVKRPAIYELKNHETFSDVISMAGGFLPSAYPKTTVVERFNKDNLRSLVNVDLTQQKFLSMSVHNGDVINVMPTSLQYEQSVTVIGAVTRPGKYQWKKGQKITNILPSIQAYTLEDADLSYSIVVREKDLGRHIEVLQFSLFNAVSDPSSADNIVLAPKDKVLIFSTIEKANMKELSLDGLDKTASVIKDQEKESVLQKYEDKQFWLSYGDKPLATNADLLTEQLALSTQSLDSLTGAQSANESIDIRDYTIFSRTRLLAPIIEQLKRQGLAGQSIQLVEVAGEVKYPGVYPLPKNGRLSQLVLAAGGLLESAYLQQGELTRNIYTDGKADKISLNINLKDVVQGDVKADIALVSKDRLNVHKIPAWQENNIVELRGEFKFPGKYTIRRGETLRDLIERAGGFTEYAYIKASVFTREKLKQMELRNLVKVSSNLRMEIASKTLAQNKSSQMIDYTQAKELLADLTKVKPVGRLVVNLNKIMQKNDYDVALENGDMLYVPTKQNSINVIGQVQVATSHLYQANLTVDDYLSLSGGIKKSADDDRIYVIKANGSIEIPNQFNWFTSSKLNKLSPGDTIVVPLNSEYMDNLSLWSTATQILYQSAVAIKAIGSL